MDTAMNLPSGMNPAAAKTNLFDTVAPADYRLHSHQDNGSSELFNEALDEIFAEIEKDQEQEQQSPKMYNPISVSYTRETLSIGSHSTDCFNNEVASLLPSDGSTVDISFEQFLTDRGIFCEAPQNPVLIPVVEKHEQHFKTQTRISSSTDNDENIQNLKRTRGSNLDGMDLAMTRKWIRKMKNRNAARRSHARKLERCVEMETEISELREENEKLKKTLQVMKAEIKNSGDKKLRRTNSFSYSM